MHESERDSKWQDEREGNVTGKVTLNDVFELQMAQLIVLQRIYDVQLALLSDVDPDRADELYEGHENGRIYGPPIAWDGNE